MASLNKVFLAGNLTRDPELRNTTKGTAIAKIGLAMNRQWRTETGEKKEEVTFVDVDMFGKMAERAEEYLRKGMAVLIEGRLKIDTWEDKQTNQKRSKLGVVAESWQFMDKKEQGSDSAPATQRTFAQAPRQAQKVEEDDVPF